MVQFKFFLGKGPPGLDPEQILCPCCDRLWAESGNSALPTKGLDGYIPAGSTANRTMNVNPPSVTTAFPPISMQTFLGGNSSRPVGAPPTNTAAASSYSSSMTSTAAAVTTVDLSTYDAALVGMSIRPNPPPSRSNTGFPGAAPYNTMTTPNTIDMTIGADPNAPLCECQLPGKLCTVVKDGPNKGRPFYGCVKPRYV